MTCTGNEVQEQFLVHMNVILTNWKILPSPSEKNLPLLHISISIHTYVGSNHLNPIMKILEQPLMLAKSPKWCVHSWRQQVSFFYEIDWLT